MSDSAPIPPKRDRFVSEYLVDLNATQAAIRCGYSKKTAYSQGHRLLKDDEIAAEISRRRTEQLSALGIEASEVLRELARLATSDLRECFDERGNLLPIDELPDSVAAAVAGVEVVMRSTGRDEPPEYVHKIKLWDKNTALTNLAKHFGLLKDLVEHSGELTHAHTLDVRLLCDACLRKVRAELGE